MVFVQYIPLSVKLFTHLNQKKWRKFLIILRHNFYIRANSICRGILKSE